MTAATNPRVLAIVTARGGSKGLPRKNILPLAGKPVIAHTLDAARRAPSVDRVVVSTDDEEIAAIARAHGGEVPFLRPAELARDETLIFPVLIHALDWLKAHDGYVPDYVLLLQPTSPFRAPEDIEAAVRIATETGGDAVISVGPAHQHPHWMKSVAADGRLVDFMPDMPFRRQELGELYALNGAIYLVATPVLLERQTFYTKSTYAYVMPAERSLDIESPWEYTLARLILEDRQRRGEAP
ncbi:MAG: NTP transferase domain-containing protein [Vicinamibacterales bacterium]